MSSSRNLQLAVLLSLLFHAMFLAIGGGGSTEQSLALALSDYQGNVAQLNGDAGTISVVLVNETGELSTASPDTAFDWEHADGRVISTAAADVSESVPEPKSPHDPSDSADSLPAAPSGAAPADRHALPLDAYHAQILGRIERAWVRPLAQMKEAFRCEVQITQSPQGEVREVTLTHCDADPAWRESIARAIRYAAPLPAPSSENAFRSVLTLNFQAEPLSPALLAQLLSVTQAADAAAPPDDGLNATVDSVPTGDTRVTGAHAR